MSSGPLHPTAARYQQLLRAHGIDADVRMLPDSARTAAEAAAALGVERGQILKSLVFLRDQAPVIVLCAGDRSVDTDRLGLARATADQVRAVTGYAIGGIPPIGHGQTATMIDVSVNRFEEIWAAAGHPHAVFPIATAALLSALPDASVVEV